jgi:nucleoside-diphosphate-sugar epimerase
MGLEAIVSEEQPLTLRHTPDALYDLSKLLGEVACSASPRKAVRVARLSNVYGADQSTATFLGTVLADIRRGDVVTIREAPLSSKDYISVDDVVILLTRIALDGRKSIYNVASGTAVTHAEIAEKLAAIGCARIDFAPGGVTRCFPLIDTRRVVTEFSFVPRSLLDDLPMLLRQGAEAR